MCFNKIRLTALSDPFHNEEVFPLPSNIKFYELCFLCITVFAILKEWTFCVRECEWDLSLTVFVGELRHCPWLLWESLTAGSKQQVAEGESGQTGSLGETVSGSPGERPNIAFGHQWKETHAPWRRVWWKPIAQSDAEGTLIGLRITEGKFWMHACVWLKLQESLGSCRTCWRMNENLPSIKICV